MKSWTSPHVPAIPPLPAALRLQETSRSALVEVPARDGVASLYVCGITPYDATHLGHANTYVQFDLLVRYWRASGLEVRYVQNVTDIDDPLLERAEATGRDWREIAEEQTELFRRDMRALGVVAPDTYLGAVETIPEVVTDVERLVELGIGYPVPVPEDEHDADGADLFDIYFDIGAAENATDWRLGSVGGYDRLTMENLFPERGGDPQRAGKRDPLDPLLWRARRRGEPYWEGGSLGQGRPGWHIECSVISRRHLPAPFTVQGGGSDLRFPHHEFSAAHATAADGIALAENFIHAGMVGLDGEKMSKSKGNLVLVSTLRQQGVDPMAIRTLLLGHHYQEDWSYTETGLEEAKARLERWRAAAEQAPQGQGPQSHHSPQGEKSEEEAAAPQSPSELQRAIHAALSDNLNAPAALTELDRWAEGEFAQNTTREQIQHALSALLGIRL